MRFPQHPEHSDPSDARVEPRRAGPPLAEPVVDAAPDGALELRWRGDRPGTGVRLDEPSIVASLRSGRLGRDQPLARAVGRGAALVADATAGLGADTLRLACLGGRVVAIERHPALAALLEDGLARLRAIDGPLGAAAARIEVVQGDAARALPALDPPPDVVYLDPMFPPKRRASALPPKSMQLLRALVGDDDDAAALLRAARRCAVRRVVVKRPDHAPPLATGAIAGYGGTLVRYDAYAPEAPA